MTSIVNNYYNAHENKEEGAPADGCALFAFIGIHTPVISFNPNLSLAIETFFLIDARQVFLSFSESIAGYVKGKGGKKCRQKSKSGQRV